MAQPVISVRNLSKLYHIGALKERYRTIRSSIAGAFERLSASSREERAKETAIWALHDVSFDVSQGEVVGLIGRNGAGKSTLLKVLSEITYPTEGRVEIHGRVGSLLEIGTGFHPELTGRENIFLNGAILGMTNVEIKRKFDEIVAFAEIDKFIDTPVKRYSSGMHVRLAFAVAAHLEPEILLVDEVLAVGDAQFQKKCMGKMGDVAKEDGRTIIFVSHNMAAIEALCDRCLLIHGGRLVKDGLTDEVVANYQANSSAGTGNVVDLKNHPGRRKHSTPMMTAASLLSETGAPATSLRMGSGLAVQVQFAFDAKPVRPVLGLQIKNFIGAPVLGVDNRFVGGYQFPEALQEGTITCRLDHLPLMPGTYFVDVYLGDELMSLDAVYDALTFEVIPGDVFASGKLPSAATGPIYWPATWSLLNSSGREISPAK